MYGFCFVYNIAMLKKNSNKLKKKNFFSSRDAFPKIFVGGNLVILTIYSMIILIFPIPLFLIPIFIVIRASIIVWHDDAVQICDLILILMPYVSYQQKGPEWGFENKGKKGLSYKWSENPNQIRNPLQSSRTEDFVVFELTANSKTP